MKKRVYVSMDTIEDNRYYYLFNSLNNKSNVEFEFFYNIKNTIRESNDYQQFDNSNLFVLLVGEHTRFQIKDVRWEINQAIKRNIPIIVVNLNGKRKIDKDLCPTILREKNAIHIPFNEKIIMHALRHWPTDFSKIINHKKAKPYNYGDNIYEEYNL